MSGMQPLIIETAINGNTPKSRNPHVPVSPDEIARDALECLDAGAAIIHNHIEDYTLNGDVAAARFLEAWRPVVRERPDVIFSPTASAGDSIERRWAHVVALAASGLCQMGWLDPGSLNVCDSGPGGMPGAYQSIYENSFADIDYQMRQMRQLRLGASIAIFEPGFLRLVLAAHRNNQLPQGSMVRFYFGGDHNPMDGVRGGLAFGLPPTRKALEVYLEMLAPSGLPWAVAVMGGDVCGSGMARLAIEQGGHVRVGLEDYAGNAQPKNRELVQQVAGIARDIGRPLASGADTRRILDLLR